MRIAMVAACPFPWPRGTPIRIHRMAEALGRRGHDVHVVTYHLGGPTPTPHMTVHRINGPSLVHAHGPRTLIRETGAARSVAHLETATAAEGEHV